MGNNTINNTINTVTQKPLEYHVDLYGNDNIGKSKAGVMGRLVSWERNLARNYPSILNSPLKYMATGIKVAAGLGLSYGIPTAAFLKGKEFVKCDASTSLCEREFFYNFIGFIALSMATTLLFVYGLSTYKNQHDRQKAQEENEEQRLRMIKALGGKEACDIIPVVEITEDEMKPDFKFTEKHFPENKVIIQAEDPSGRKFLGFKCDKGRTLTVNQKYRETSMPELRAPLDCLFDLSKFGANGNEWDAYLFEPGFNINAVCFTANDRRNDEDAAVFKNRQIAKFISDLIHDKKDWVHLAKPEVSEVTVPAPIVA